HVRPSIDVMLSSAVKVYGGSILGVILTGMGKDGAAAMVELKKAGGRTVVQDRSTSVIYNMPKAVIDRGAADLELPLEEISRFIADVVGGSNHGNRSRI
ncbi:MAG TPA: chemotaxis protein CheB, partial [Firmicutes bacterium]|nr:chemotaxis protein CheB [Bacillota bacterium]